MMSCEVTNKMHKSKRSPFTCQENAFIRESVKRYGEDWETIARCLPGRSPKQVHDRYINYLREGLIKSPWTKQEDDVLLLMYKAIGPKWSKMMINLPGRSGNDIKNRWHKHLSKNSRHLLETDTSDFILTSNTLPNYNQISSDPIHSEQKCSNCNIIQSSPIIPQSNVVAASSFQHLSGLVEPIIKTSTGNEITLNQKMHSELKHEELGKNNNLNFNNISKPNFESLNKNDEKVEEKSIKIINKVNLDHGAKETNFFIESNQMPDYDSFMIKHDFDIQEILEDIYSENVEFPWI